jgi:hypothetical protein
VLPGSVFKRRGCRNRPVHGRRRAIYSYEGTREINTLIVGRAITGTGAFV